MSFTPVPRETPFMDRVGNKPSMAWQMFIEDFHNGLKFAPYTRENSVKWYGAKGDGVTDDTVALQSALDANNNVFFDEGTYQLSDELLLNSNQRVTLSSSVRINQTATDKNIFKAIQKDNIVLDCNNAVLYGEGTYYGGGHPLAWTGNSGHEDRGIQFLGCTKSRIDSPIVKNCGNAGICIIGGSQISIITPIIEGTNNYSTPIVSEDNFQHGLYLQHNATYGDLDDIFILGPDISGTTQGMLLETYGAFAEDANNIVVSSPVIHDITGQHGFYLQSGKVNIIGPVIDNVNLSGIKVQSGNPNFDIKDITASGFSISNVGSHAIELQTTGLGWFSGFYFSGVCQNVQRGLGINNKVRDGFVDIVVSDSTQYGCIIQGADVHDVDIRIKSKRSGRTGILIAATNSDNIRLWPTVLESNTTASNYSGVEIQSASTDVSFFDPVIKDADTNQVYGLFSSIAGSNIYVYGSATITGCSSYAVRATTTPFGAWPIYVTLQGTAGTYFNKSLVAVELSIDRDIQGESNITTEGDFILDKAVSNNRDIAWQTSGSLRWKVRGDKTAESGSDAGSQFIIQAYNDSGTIIDEPLIIQRKSGGLFTVYRILRVRSGTFRITGLGGTSKNISLQNEDLDRFIFRLTSDSESGSNAGSNFSFQARADDASLIDVVMSVDRVAGATFYINRPVSLPEVLTTDSGRVKQISSKNTDYTILSSDYTTLLDATSNTVTATLPSSPVSGEWHNIKCLDATFTCTIGRNGNTIDGAASDLTLATNEAVSLQYFASNWNIVANK